jgi:hypothetical protein
MYFPALWSFAEFPFLKGNHAGPPHQARLDQAAEVRDKSEVEKLKAVLITTTLL